MSALIMDVRNFAQSHSCVPHIKKYHVMKQSVICDVVICMLTKASRNA